MKKLAFVILSIIFIVSASGCAGNDKYYDTVVTFYYCADKIDYTPDASVMQCEERIVDCPPNEYKTIMQIYLNGPEKHGMYSPFPSGLTISEFIVDGDTTYVTFSENLSYLSGVDLTLACMCIANTCFALTHTQNVDISAEHVLLDNAPSILISSGTSVIS